MITFAHLLSSILSVSFYHYVFDRFGLYILSEYSGLGIKDICVCLVDYLSFFSLSVEYSLIEWCEPIVLLLLLFWQGYGNSLYVHDISIVCISSWIFRWTLIVVRSDIYFGSYYLRFLWICQYVCARIILSNGHFWINLLLNSCKKFLFPFASQYFNVYLTDMTNSSLCEKKSQYIRALKYKKKAVWNLNSCSNYFRYHRSLMFYAHISVGVFLFILCFAGFTHMGSLGFFLWHSTYSHVERCTTATISFWQSHTTSQTDHGWYNRY